MSSSENNRYNNMNDGRFSHNIEYCNENDYMRNYDRTAS